MKGTLHPQECNLLSFVLCWEEKSYGGLGTSSQRGSQHSNTGEAANPHPSLPYLLLIHLPRWPPSEQNTDLKAIEMYRPLEGGRQALICSSLVQGVHWECFLPGGLDCWHAALDIGSQEVK